MRSCRSLAILSSFGLLIAVIGLAWNALVLRPGVGATSTPGQFYRVCAIVSTPLDALLLAASALALCGRANASRLLQTWAILAVFYASGRLAWAIAVVAPAATAAARKAAAGLSPSEFGPDFAGFFFSVIAGVVFIVTCILPISVILVIRSRPYLIAARAHP